MTRNIAIIVALLGPICISGTTLVAAAREGDESLSALVQRATSGSADSSLEAIEELRARGPAGLAALLEMRRAVEQQPSTSQKSGTDRPDPRLEKLDRLIDHVAGQRYACASRLYWYTDFEQAKAVAAASGKPILSLRMLGNLTDEYSCANSRFFRTTLYSNEKIAEKLREHFVLHWKSVRPVPRVTIDFGDGRKLERTVTGNSIHYLLAADGRPLDALPGLYGPQQFLAWLERCEQLHTGMQKQSPADRSFYLQLFHESARQQIAQDWARDITTVGADTASAAATTHAKLLALRSRSRETAPRADNAAELARPKLDVERPLIQLLAGELNRISKATTDEVWETIAALPTHAVELDRASVSVIERENPTAAMAGRVAVTKKVVEDPLVRMLNKLRSSIALDTVRNEYTLHRQIHDWFAAEAVPADVDMLNERVYAELFLTPSSDPWLGLAPDDTYTALPGGGVSTTAR